MNEIEKSEVFYLSWLDPQKGTRKPAGVAFYETGFSDYRLKIDFFPENQYYLRCLGGDNNQVRYRLEVVHKNKEGKFLRRVPVGEGYSTPQNEVRITPFPFEKELILTLRETKE